MFKLIAVVLLVNLLETECLYNGDYCKAEERPGICKPLAKCPTLVSEIRRAGNPMPMYIRKRLQKLSCGFEGKDPMVCCSLTSTTEDTDFPGLTSAPDRDGKPDDSINSLDQEDNVEEFTRRTTLNGPEGVQNHPNLHLLPRKCGNIESDKIWGGDRTNLFEMPWMVLLSYNSDRGPRLSCGGTLITERYVLTAAHCVSFLGSSLVLDSVVLGEYDTRTDPDCTRMEGDELCAPGVRNVTVEEVTAHPGYTLQSLADDIALIRLAQPADFSLDSMKPICLPVTQELQTEALVGRYGVVAGWGVSEEGLQSPVLLSVDLPIIAKAECAKKYKGSPHITDKQICAGGIKDKDSCGGDSGGPLLYPGTLWSSGAHYIQRGVVSYGPKRCGIGGLPGVYTNVAYYMKWILDNIRN